MTYVDQLSPAALKTYNKLHTHLLESGAEYISMGSLDDYDLLYLNLIFAAQSASQVHIINTDYLIRRLGPLLKVANRELAALRSDPLFPKISGSVYLNRDGSLTTHPKLNSESTLHYLILKHLVKEQKVTSLQQNLFPDLTKFVLLSKVALKSRAALSTLIPDEKETLKALLETNNTARLEDLLSLAKVAI